MYLPLSFLPQALQWADTSHITPLMQAQTTVLKMTWQATFLVNSKHGANRDSNFMWARNSGPNEPHHCFSHGL